MMNRVDNESVREALINLDRSREKERALREESNNLLKGLEIITSATGTDDMLGRLLQMVTEQLQCDDAFILSPVERSDGEETEEKTGEEAVEYHCIGTTNPLFSTTPWVGGELFQRVQEEHPAMLFSTARIPEWQRQSEEVREQSLSALLIAFPRADLDRQIMLIATNRTPAFFKKSHLGLMQRLVPIASHALHTLHINEKLQCEIDERNRLQQYSSFQAGIAEMNASVLHNIGNSITGAQGHLMKLGNQRKKLNGLVKVLETVETWMSEGAITEEKQEKVRKVAIGAVKLLETAVAEKGVIDRGVEALERSNQHVAEIIQIQRGVSQPILTASWFRIDEMVSDTIGMIEESINKRSIDVSVMISPLLEKLYLPRNPMIQMLLNLIKNSVESIDERTQRTPGYQGMIEIRLEPVDQLVQLMVEDNGVGVEPEWAPSIFKFGKSSKKFGSGFGLHSVANFISSVGGDIKVESEGRDQGATMVVTLPAEVTTEES